MQKRINKTVSLGSEKQSPNYNSKASMSSFANKKSQKEKSNMSERNKFYEAESDVHKSLTSNGKNNF